MKRETGLLAAMVFLAAAPLMLAQNAALPTEILGPQLIAWSQLQKPQPVPQPMPPPDRLVQQSDSQQQPAPVPTQQQATQTLTGAIVKDGSGYVLKVADGTAYQLDSQDRAKRYEGKRVNVSGDIDAGNSFHIINIELIS